MRTTVILPDSLLIAAKAVAAQRKTTLKAMVKSALRREVAPQENLAPEVSKKMLFGPFPKLARAVSSRGALKHQAQHPGPPSFARFWIMYPRTLAEVHLGLLSWLGLNAPHPAWGHKRLRFRFCELRNKAAHRLVGASKAKVLKILVNPLDAQTQRAFFADGGLKT